MTTTEGFAECRNASLADIANLLQVRQEAKTDAVVPAQAIRSDRGVIQIAGMGPFGNIGDPGLFVPTSTGDTCFADKLNIPVSYLRRMRTERPDLYDANINGWIHGDGAQVGPDDRKFLVRAFKPQEMFGTGVLRAVLSDGYFPIDDLDGLTAVLSGIRESGIEAEVLSADLTADRMVVKVAAPGIAVLAPKLLDGYRNPLAGGGRSGYGDNVRARVGGWTVPDALAAAAREGHGYKPGEEPVLFGGFKISNSETGGGAWQIVPEAVIKVCSNGLTMTVDALRRAHLGSRLDEGFNWSNDTHRRNLQLIQAQARDAVTRFLSVEYWTEKAEAVEEKAGKVLENPAELVKHIGSQLKFSDEVTASVLDFFIKGGQPTSGGVFQAITAASQTVDDVDVEWDMQAKAVQGMELAFAG